MDTRTLELVAVGASVTANCQPCLSYHVAKARESGASQEEILEAIDMAKLVRRGAAKKMDEFTNTVLEESEAPVGDTKDGLCGKPGFCCT